MKVIQYLMPSYFLSHALVHLGNWCYKASEWIQGDSEHGPWQEISQQEAIDRMNELMKEMDDGE